ncbi:MAG: HlyD family secretion protein [Desulfobacteraceae bacterium]|nr:HlyD family secretion protein [Desulfobacteraceae bacterium]MBC2750062.1 HlyD family secretion protein [Desulfobacteraceae bacterium]
MKKYLKYLLTGLVIAVAVILVLFKYRDYVTNPWTRDGQVRANVIQIAPRVSGPIVNLPIRDNQFVKAGDVLFAIDPRTFEASYDQARAQLDQTGDNVQALEQQVEAARAGVDVAKASVDQARATIAQLEATIAKNKADYERQQDLLPKKATSRKALEQAQASYEVSIQQKVSAQAGFYQAQAALAESKAALAEAEAQLGALGDANPKLRTALAALRQAELNLEFTEVRAPVDGYITNLNLRLGSQVVANQPVLALVDAKSFWVDGFFKETAIGRMQGGDRAVVTLMAYPDTPLEGAVDSIGWGIAQQDGSTGFELLPNVSPTFQWIRLAQRVPVRVHLTDVPEGIDLRVGTTCSVLVKTGTAGKDDRRPVPPAPKAFQ